MQNFAFSPLWYWDQLIEFITKPISFRNKLWLMGNVSHLCFSLLATVAPTCFRTALLDDTPGEQMCSNEFILSSDMREVFFHYFSVILLVVQSSELERHIQGLGTNHFFGREIKHTSIHSRGNQNCFFFLRAYQLFFCIVIFVIILFIISFSPFCCFHPPGMCNLCLGGDVP